jgi:bifunctional DNase/RNase
MKYLLVFFCCLLVACAGTPVIDSPPEDCVILSPHSGMPIIIKQGFFNDMSRVWTLEEFQAEYEKFVKQYYGM